ncbi:MAG: hypothetical protein WBG11_11945 [Methylocella sp.]
MSQDTVIKLAQPGEFLRWTETAEVLKFGPIASGTSQRRAAGTGAGIFNLSRVQWLICHIGSVTIRVVL